MKICAIICEYNPFHNGHKYLLEQAKRLSGCDAVLCIMSASFTQRGEAAILPKFVRAEHAVLGGADCVIQLPAAFSVAPAEIFARGAISILKSIPAVTHLAFGSEVADEEAIERAAGLFNDIKADGQQNFQISGALARHMTAGQSYKRSLALALEEMGAESTLVTSPNGLLAIEYTRAIKRFGADIKIIPVQRMGAGYGDSSLKENFSSASAIRANLGDNAVESNVPGYVLKTLKNTDAAGAKDRFDCLLRYALCTADRRDMQRIFGCTEGLENKLKNCVNMSAGGIIGAATGKRYTSSRIRRILTANMLGIYSDEVKRYIDEGTYIKPLAVCEDKKEEIFAELAKSPLPVIIKKMSLSALGHTDKRINSSAQTPAFKCYKTDIRADFARSLIYGGQPEYEYTVKIVP